MSSLQEREGEGEEGKVLTTGEEGATAVSKVLEGKIGIFFQLK